MFDELKSMIMKELNETGLFYMQDGECGEMFESYLLLAEKILDIELLQAQIEETAAQKELALTEAWRLREQK